MKIDVLLCSVRILAECSSVWERAFHSVTVHVFRENLSICKCVVGMENGMRYMIMKGLDHYLPFSYSARFVVLCPSDQADISLPVIRFVAFVQV